ncbi:hypothetical protein M1718_24260 [Salmonella enterica subsp. enterica serovar Oranienburg]|nr:hypothetical protein [Salmonella enterica]MCT7044778.1 hypothetical protein [Salmonella enterica subsp. enterica serovar Soahanina]MCT7242301.1 hypothetical protein [Salmonella enterica subsp. enterica serovar Oranienburg]
MGAAQTPHEGSTMG